MKKLYGATYGNVVSVLSVHHQASVTVAEVEDAKGNLSSRWSATNPCDQKQKQFREWGSTTPVT